jgi:ubiquinone/menaquinone biosynthesis C-methylase UbiE
MSDIIDYYSSFDEWGRLDREPLEFIVNLHYIKKYMPSTGKVLDNGAGPGKYAMELAKLGYKVTLSDITPKLVEVATEKASELQLTQQFDGFHNLNAINLDGIPDEHYDVTLMLGPLYHLQQEEERNLAVQELHRVTKQDGLVFVAFQSRMRMTINSLQSPQQWKPNDNMNNINEFYESGIFNYKDKGRFTGAYYFNIDEIRPFMEQSGFESIDLIGSSSFAAMLNAEQQQYWAQQEGNERLTNFLISKANDPSILGISSHLLYIGKRK